MSTNGGRSFFYLSRNSHSQLDQNSLWIENYGKLVERCPRENSCEKHIPYREPDHLVASTLLYIAVANVALDRREKLHDGRYDFQRRLKYKTWKVSSYYLTYGFPATEITNV